MIYFVFPDGYKKDRQYNGQKIKKYKMTNKDLQNIAQKTKDRATRTPLKSRGELMCSGGIAVPAPSVAHVVLLLLQTGVQLFRKGCWLKECK